MATRYFGNTLSDLQSALTEADRIEAEKAAARARNETQLSQAMIAQATQRDALQQQAIQQAQANQLSQQQLNQTDYFNRGRLTNEADRIRADRMLAERQMSETGLDRASRERIASMMAGSRDRAPEIVSQENELAIAAANFANILNERDKIQNDLAGLDVIDKQREARGNEWFTRNSTAEREAMPQLQRFVPNATPGMDYNVALTAAKKGLQDQLANLSAIAAAGQQSEIGALVTRGPNGKWISTFKPSTRAASPYFNVPQTQSVTNGAPQYFNTPPPAENRDALIQKITDDFRAGRIDRATAEQGLRALGLQ